MKLSDWLAAALGRSGRAYVSGCLVLLYVGALMGCGNDGDASQGSLGLHIESLASPGGGPRYMLRGNDATVQVWTQPGGQASQATYTSHSGAVKTRVVYDAASGEVSRIIDELTGNYIIISETVGRMEFSEYDARGEFLRAFALTSDAGTYKLGKLVGRPAIEGQLQGQLTGVRGAKGSFALIPVGSAALEDMQDVTAQMHALIERGSGAAAARDFGGIGVTVSPLVSVSRMLRLGGLVVLGAGLAASAPAYAAAGVAMIMSGYFTNDVANQIESKFATDDPLAKEFVDLAVSNLRDERSVGLVELCQRILDKAQSAGEAAQSTLDQLQRSWREHTTFDEVDYYTYLSDLELPADALTLPTGRPPRLPTDVTGQVVFADNSAYTLTGSVDADGNLHVTGQGADDPSAHISISGDIDAQGELTSQFTSDSDSGKGDGQVRPVGACEAVQASGGQGTFTNAHFVGGGGGRTTFFYDAYTVPDAFTVRSQSTFATGGLVSGSGTTEIEAAEDGFVFVSVSAPEDGTAWEYSLTCVAQAPAGNSP